MKKVFPLILLAVLGAAAWYFSAGRGATGPGAGDSASGSAGSDKSIRSDMINDINILEGSGDNAGGENGADAEGDGVFNSDGETKPASQVYSSAEAALKAVQTGAKDYDDLVLEQFTLPGEDCTWCPQFYKGVKDLLADQALPADQRSYYAEILAVSGSVDNLATLVDGVKDAPAKEIADAYAEALELTVGRDDVVQFLSDHMNSSNDTLREAAVAAVTNQGSRLAAETLYKNTVERGDADGYYSVGIGLAELVPDEETLPYLQELAMKRDQYSHLAVKSLINGGQPGLQIVFDILNNSSGSDDDRQLIKDAVDHVNYDEETEAFLKKTLETSKNPAAIDFAKSILDDFNSNNAPEEDIADQLLPEEEPTPPMTSME